MAKPARKPAPDYTEEVFRSAAPGASQESVDDLLKNLKRRKPGAPPPKPVVVEEPPPKPKAELPGMALPPVPDSPQNVVRSAVSKAKEQDQRARDSKRRLQAPKRSTTVRIILGIGALIAVGLGIDLYLMQPAPVQRTDYSADVADILPLTELHDHGSQWIGVVEADWGGVFDPAIAQEACLEVRNRALVPTGLTLYTTTGQNLITCGL